MAHAPTGFRKYAADSRAGPLREIVPVGFVAALYSMSRQAVHQRVLRGTLRPMPIATAPRGWYYWDKAEVILAISQGHPGRKTLPTTSILSCQP